MDDNRPVVEDAKVASALEEKREEVYNTTAIEKPATRSINDVVEDTRLVSGYDDRTNRTREEESRPRTSISDFGPTRGRHERTREEEPRSRSVYSDDRDRSSVRAGRRSIGIDDFNGGSSRSSNRSPSRRPSW